MAEDNPKYNLKLEGQTKGLAIGDNNIIYNYFGYREQAKAEPVAADDDLYCPYRGLYHFNPNDAEFFFGRDVFVDELFEAIQNRNFIPVLGASGSGKSSVVLAGLVPKLEQEGHWKFTHFRPGSDPFHALALALVPLYTPELDDTDQIAQARKLASYLNDNTIPLSDVFAKIKQNNPNHRILLIADQFEELYTQCSDSTVRRRFLDCLLTSFQFSNSGASFSTVLVTTMRADFLANALAYRPFADMLQNQDIKLGAMNREELAEVIEKPAEKLGVSFEAGLIERILDDVEDEPGNLPLLEFALTELWEKRTGKQLTHNDYEGIGQVKGALADYADDKYKKLTADEQEQARRIFIQLVRPGEGTEDTRRRANCTELGEENWDLITRKDGLADSRLVVTSRNDTEQETVEVVHEALIQNWVQLKEWMEADRKFRVWQERLRVAMRQWEATRKDQGSLLRGAALAEAEEKLTERPKDLISEKGFIQQSIIERDSLLKKAEERRLKSLILAWSITSGSIIMLGIISILGWVAFQNARNANIQAVQALTQTVEASLTSNQPFDALLAAIRAGRKLKDANLTNTELLHPTLGALLEATGRVKESNRLEGQKIAFLTTKFSPDGQTIAAVDRYGTVKLWQRDGGLIKSFDLDRVAGGDFYFEEMNYDVLDFSPDSQKIVAVNVGIIEIWNRDGTSVNQIRDGFVEQRAVKFSPDGQLIASIGDDGSIVLWHWQKNNTPIVIQGHQHVVNALKFSPDGQTIATASKDGTAKLWKLDGTLLATFSKYTEEFSWGDPSSSVTDVEFSPDGRIIATANTDATVNLWRRDGTLLTTLKSSEYFDSESLDIVEPYFTINDVEFSPDGKTIAMAASDRTVRLWKLDGTLLATLGGHEDEVNIVQFSPDGQIIASATDNGVVKLWQKNGTLLATLVGHTDWVRALDFSSDGKTLASASGDGTVKLWQLHDSPLTILKGNSVEFSPDGQTIATATGKGKIELWRLDGTPIITLEGDEVRFSPDGQIIATQIDKDRVKLWQQDGTPLATLEGHGAQFSPDSQLIATIEGIERFQDEPLPEVIKLWQQSGTLITTLKGHTDLIEDVQFSPDSLAIVTASRDNILKLWQRNGTLIATLQADSEFGSVGVSTIRFSPNGQRIASLIYDGTVQLWQRNGNLIRTFPPVGEHRTAEIWFMGGSEVIRFSPDGQIIAAVSADGNVGLWQENGKLLTTLSLHPQSFGKVEFSPDLEIIATSIDGGNIRLWQRDGKPLATLKGDGSAGLQFSPDGRTLASVGGDIVLWPFDLDNLLERSCSWLHDYLSNNPNVKAEEREICGVEPSAHLIAEEGRNLAKEGDVEGAIAKLQKAIEINPNLNLDPKKELAIALMERVEKLLIADEVSEAIVVYQEVQQLIPTLGLDIQIDSWNQLCWLGSLHGHAAEVITACDKAVSLVNKGSVFDYFDYRDSRGIARALTGNLRGAIEDFQAFIESPYTDEEEKAKRQGWIDALRTGKNPFTKEELESLLCPHCKLYQ